MIHLVRGIISIIFIIQDLIVTMEVKTLHLIGCLEAIVTGVMRIMRFSLIKAKNPIDRELVSSIKKNQ